MTIQVSALALSNSALAHVRMLAQRMRASTMRLRRPTFLPSTADRKRLFVHPCCLHHRKSTHEAAKASETFSDHVRTRPESTRVNIVCSTKSSARARDGSCSASSRSLLLLLPVRLALLLPLWTSGSGELVQARPAGWDGRMGSRGRPSEAALGSDGGVRASFSVYYRRVASARSRARDHSTGTEASGWWFLRRNLVAGGRTKTSRAQVVADEQQSGRWRHPRL